MAGESVLMRPSMCGPSTAPAKTRKTTSGTARPGTRLARKGATVATSSMITSDSSIVSIFLAFLMWQTAIGCDCDRYPRGRCHTCHTPASYASGIWPVSRIWSKAASSRTGTPRLWALVSFEPAFSPAIT